MGRRELKSKVSVDDVNGEAGARKLGRCSTAIPARGPALIAAAALVMLTGCKEDRCRPNLDAAARALKQGSWNAAQTAARDARYACPADTTELDALERKIRAHDEEERKASVARATELRAQPKPPVDEAAAQLAEDRRAGVKLTRKGFVAATSLEKIQQATKYAAAGDKEGWTLFVQSDPAVTLLDDGLRVVPIKRGGPLGVYVRVRVQGTLDELWMSKDALRDP